MLCRIGARFSRTSPLFELSKPGVRRAALGLTLFEHTGRLLQLLLQFGGTLLAGTDRGERPLDEPEGLGEVTLAGLPLPVPLIVRTPRALRATQKMSDRNALTL